MVIWQNCVVCGRSVDVDNYFGTIGEGETFCNEHENIQKALENIKQIKDAVWALNYSVQKDYERIYDFLCTERTKMKYKTQHEKVQE